MCNPARAGKEPSAAASVVLLDGHLSWEGSELLRNLAPAASMRPHPDGAAVIGFTAEQEVALADFALGQLACSRFLALGRTSLWWMTPACGSSAEVPLPGETQFLLTELAGGGYGLLLPLLDAGTFRATLRGPSKGSAAPEHIVLRLESGDASVRAASWQSALYVAAGPEPYALVQRGVAAAAALSGAARPRAQKEVPPSVDVFGWCTWDAFYSKVSAAGVAAGLKSLAAGGVAPRLVIIDDGWQQTDVDPEHRDAAAHGCVAGGAHAPSGSPQHEVEEAAAELLAGPDNNMETTLHAVHEMDAEEEQEEEAAKEPPGTPPMAAKAVQQEEPRACSALAGLLRGAGAVLARAEVAALRLCKSVVDAAPAGSWRLRAFGALATGPFRGAVLRFYASASDHTRRLTSVRANSKFLSPEAEAGPDSALSSTKEDLRWVVSDLKERYGVRYVYCWHAAQGFWGGLGKGDPGVAGYGQELVMPQPTPGILEVDPCIPWMQPVLAGLCFPRDPTALHSDMHAYLAAAGVDGVKVDVQGTVGLAGSGAGGGPALAAAYHRSLEASAQRHFPGNHFINCMCHSSEDLYAMSHTAVGRVSDDFYPGRTPSHTAHLANCAYNSLFMGELLIPDWDMFHSQHPAAGLHAAARAVSGGPVYVSDRPGRHDFGLLRRLVLPGGGVLRCVQPGRPTPDCLFADPQRDGRTALKVWNRNAVSGVVGAFNIQGSSWSRPHRRFHTHDPAPPAVDAAVGPADVPDLPAAGAFALWSDSAQSLEIVSAGSAGVRLSLPPGGSDVVTIVPLAEAGGVAVAPIGLVSMLNPGGAVLSCRMEAGASTAAPAAGEEEGGGREATVGLQLVSCHLTLRGCGRVLVFCSQRPSAVELDGAPAEFTYEETSLAFELAEGQSACRIQF